MSISRFLVSHLKPYQAYKPGKQVFKSFNLQGLQIAKSVAHLHTKSRKNKITTNLKGINISTKSVVTHRKAPSANAKTTTSAVTSTIVKLNTNENPYPLSQQTQDSFLKLIADPSAIPTTNTKASIASLSSSMSLEGLRLYPDPEQTQLRQIAAKKLRVKPNQLVFGNGSDEILGAIFRAFIAKKDRVAIPTLTYGAYHTYAGLYGVAICSLRRSTFSIDLNSHDSDLRRCKAFFLANPNSPTGLAIPSAQILAAIQRHQNTLFVVDEAYIDFAKIRSIKDATKFCDNLIVLRTLSKSASLAGARTGYAIAHPTLIAALKMVLDPYNVNFFSQALAVATFLNYEKLREQSRRIVFLRKRLLSALAKREFVSLGSEANFIFTQPPPLAQSLKSAIAKPPHSSAKLPSTSKRKKPLVHEHNATFWLNQLEKRGILVRHVTDSYHADPLARGYLRISVGSEADNARLLQAIDEIALSG